MKINKGFFLSFFIFFFISNICLAQTTFIKKTADNSNIQTQKYYSEYYSKDNQNNNYYAYTSWGTNALNVLRNHQVTKPNAIHYIKNTDYQLYEQILNAHKKGEPYLLWVNVPSFTLRVYDTQNGNMVLKSRVVIGAPGSQTPSFNTQIINLKFNPDWTPPASLKRRGAHYMPPSDHNPLGQVRFSTNDKYSIYLHDTNHRKYFDRNYRALSSGCIRVEQWKALAEILGNLTSEEVTQNTKGNHTHYMDIPNSGVWVSYHRIDFYYGVLSLYPDIYRKDNLTIEGVPEHSKTPVALY